MRIWSLMIIFSALLSSFSPARAGERPVRVLTTLSVLQELVEEIGGERVKATHLASPFQDPHYIQPKPTLMQMARKADMFIEVGLQLELWAEKVVVGAGNPKIQSGQPGRVIASSGVRTLEMPTVLSREWGDIHPYGNPHIWLDPINLKQMARNILEGLRSVDPDGAEGYEKREVAFENRIDLALFGADLVAAVGGGKLTRLSLEGTLIGYLQHHELLDRLGGWLQRSRPLWGKDIVTYHKTWIYFTSRFGLKIRDEIEEFPGIAPGARHRDRLVEMIRRENIQALMVSNFYRMQPVEYISEKTGARILSVPIDVGGSPETADYFLLIGHILDQLLGVYGNPDSGV